MALQEIHSWTLGGLIGAFVDLVIAYFLLCGSAFAFFASKLFMFFGLFLPCPCKGSFGFRNSNFCVHKILFEWPSRKISSIQVMAVKRFPFDVLWLKGHSCNASDKMVAQKPDVNRLVELEDEASCSSCASPRLLSLDKENGYDAKGKRIMSLKRRSGIRRRRRSSYDCGKNSSIIPSDNLQSDVALTSCLPCDGSIIRDRTSESIYPAPGKEVSVHDVEDAQTSHDLDEKTCHSYEFNGSIVDSPEQDRYSSSLEHYNYMSNMQDNVQIIGNEGDRIKMLENALKEEKSAYAALYQELEKERAASATAADEAMAMISRLQEEKASMEMEMRQYQRMIEERDAYEEEEMNILQEVLIRRERECHILEKELEAYRQTDSNGRDGRPKLQLDEWGRRPPVSVETYEDPLQIESTVSIVKQDEILNTSSNYMVAQNYINTEDGEELEKNKEHKGQVHKDLHSSFYDTEPDVLDVHVVDDNIELREEENGNLHSSSSDTVSNEHDVSVGGPTSQLSMFSNSICKILPFDSGSDSSCAVHNEQLKIDNEIEILRERLRMVKHEKEKLTSFTENRESDKDRLKLENIANHLQQIKQLRNPVRGASLPPSSSKASLKKRRSQSASWETCESC